MNFEFPQIKCINCERTAPPSRQFLEEIGRNLQDGDIVCCTYCYHPMTIVPDGLRRSTKQECLAFCAQFGHEINPKFLENAI